jgi:hypothetical protein
MPSRREGDGAHTRHADAQPHSPDGKKVVYVSDRRRYNLYILSLDKKDTVQLTTANEPLLLAGVHAGWQTSSRRASRLTSTTSKADGRELVRPEVARLRRTGQRGRRARKRCVKWGRVRRRSALRVVRARAT